MKINLWQVKELKPNMSNDMTKIVIFPNKINIECRNENLYVDIFFNVFVVFEVILIKSTNLIKLSGC